MLVLGRIVAGLLVLSKVILSLIVLGAFFSSLLSIFILELNSWLSPVFLDFA